MSPLVIGLTGGIGSGKSTVADLFVAQGIELVDTDAIAHQLTAATGAAMPALQAEFGTQVLALDGALDRAAMRRLVFNDPAARQRLEAILHPLIRAEADARCQAARSPYVILAVPLLVESGSYRQRCERIVVVDCPESVQIERVMQRSGLSAVEVEAILAVQATRAARLAIADAIVDNSGPLADLQPQVARLHDQYLQLAQEKLKQSVEICLQMPQN